MPPSGNLAGLLLLHVVKKDNASAGARRGIGPAKVDDSRDAGSLEFWWTSSLGIYADEVTIAADVYQVGNRTVDLKIQEADVRSK